MLVELTVVEQRYWAVIDAFDGLSVTDVARRNGVTRQTVHSWLRRYRQSVVHCGGLDAELLAFEADAALAVVLAVLFGQGRNDGADGFVSCHSLSPDSKRAVAAKAQL